MKDFFFVEVSMAMLSLWKFFSDYTSMENLVIFFFLYKPSLSDCAKFGHKEIFN